MEPPNEGNDVLMNAERQNLSDEESETAGDDFFMMDESDDEEGEFPDPDDIYGNLIYNLQEFEGEINELRIRNIEDIQAIHDNIDDFCVRLAGITRLTVLTLGCDRSSPDWNDNQRKVTITEETSTTWNRFFSGLEGLERIDEPCIFGANLSGEIIARTLSSTCHSVERIPDDDPSTVCVYMPLWQNDNDVVPLIQAVSNLECQWIVMELSDKAPRRENDATQKHFLQEGTAFHRLIHEHGWCSLHFDGIQFTLNESRALAHDLSTNGFATTVLAIRNCTFDEGGGKLVASAFRDNTSLKSVSLFGVWNDDCFSDEFVLSFPSNTSVETFSGGMHTSVFQDVVKNIGEQNHSVKEIRLYYEGELCDAEKETLKCALSRNYTLEDASFHRYPLQNQDSQSDPFGFRTILPLNKAGRRYLAEDAASRSKCIAVLAKVKHNLDCLYYHMRENPVLCMGFTGSSGNGDENKKRKATGVSSSEGPTTKLACENYKGDRLKKRNHGSMH